MSCNVAFIGLGVMGYPMAGYISKAGHNVTVYNRTSSKADKWIKEYKGSKADTPARAAEGADYIFTCVGNDNDLREVTFGDNGIFKTIKKGAVYIDNTTASATIAREINDHAKKNGFGSLDAPVSGGQAGAENGGDIVYDKPFENFKLSLEWKIGEGGNSGIFYLAQEGQDKIWRTAPEMQVLDNERHIDAELGKDGNCN